MTVNGATREQRSQWTIAAVLAWASTDFRKRGIDSARLDAELLLAHALGTNRLSLIVESARELQPRELESYRKLIERRRNAEPIAYIIGRREFYGIEMRVDSRVLVPRPDTEILVEVALRRTQRLSLHGRAWDVCTGSGCVAIALGRARPTWTIWASDLSADALCLAELNVLATGSGWNVVCCAGDLLAAVPEATELDLITANPPYVPSTEITKLAPDIQRHEPHLALDGGADGLTLIRRIVADAPRCLRDGGLLAIEVGAGQSQAVTELFRARGFGTLECTKDYGGWERVVSGYWLGN